MIKKLFTTVRKTVSGQAAFEDVASIIRHHRIQASPGYRAAAQYVLAELHKAGIAAEIESYPAEIGTKFWTASSFQEWEAQSATLHLVEPEEHALKLADYRELKISLIQRSLPFEGTAELALLEDGLTETEYEGLDLAGKIVLTKGRAEAVRQLAVEKFNALGVIYYGMSQLDPVREPIDLPDARQYTSFWWQDYPGERKCFGFVLSPRQGEWLSQLIRQRAKEGKSPVRVHAQVDAKLYDGRLEVVSALIPGETAEEAVVVGHLCHPQPSANDNASGAAAALETARALQQLIQSGQLPKPKRGIRFLWVPEMYGTYAYLQTHEEQIPQMIAGINLDMVGSQQELSGASFLLERPPDASSSFIPALLERLREELFDDAKTHTGLGGYPLFRYATTGFSGGSDHYIFSDPTVAVPMAMLITMPDKFYHTSADTLDKIDPAMLARAASLAAGLSYFIANAGPHETTWLAYEMDSRFRAEIAQQVQALVTQVWNEELAADTDLLERRLAYQLACYQDALGSLNRLSDEIEPLVVELSNHITLYLQEQLDRGRQAIAAYPSPVPVTEQPADEWEQKAAAFIPRRLYRGPASFGQCMLALPKAEQDAWFKMVNARSGGGYTLPVLAEYWADGQRTALGIVDLVEMEAGLRDAELVVQRFEYLAKLDLVELIPVSAED